MESSEDICVEEAESSVYRSPMDCPPPSISSNVIPRRQLPDKMPYRFPTTIDNQTIQDSDVINEKPKDKDEIFCPQCKKSFVNKDLSLRAHFENIHKDQTSKI